MCGLVYVQLFGGGVHIADGVVIGAGSVVLKDVGPYEIWAGNPARFIRKRFDEDTIERLLKVQWWKLDDEQLKMYGKFMPNVKEFLEMVEKEEH